MVTILNPPTRKVFDWQISFGNIITIITLLISLAVGYTRLQEKVSIIATDLSEHKYDQAHQMNQFVRKDVQDTRNAFIDKQLYDIQVKLDQIIKLVE